MRGKLELKALRNNTSIDKQLQQFRVKELLNGNSLILLDLVYFFGKDKTADICYW